jgi:polyisoprenyl-teichoic acid--peptidoglycan teichoic acid transferase
MRPWLLTAALAVFIVGGFVGGAIGIRNLSALSRPGRSAPPSAVAASTSEVPRPVATPELAPHPPLRDFDQNPPPFEPAAAADVSTPVALQTPGPDVALKEKETGHLNILLLGIDQRPDEATPSGDPGRTDSMLLVSIDFDDHMVAMVSIPRDGFVVIPGHGNERINAAYTFGELDHRGDGPALAQKTVEQVFGITIDRYALVDVHSMQQVIDDLGGVWIDNPERLIDPQYPTDDYRTIKIDIPAGRQLMNGVTAVEYARTRHPDSDYGRENRQQQVLLAIRDRALQLDVLPRLPQLLPEVRDLVSTDISLVEAVQLANFGRSLDASEIVRLRPDPSLTPSYVGYGGASYINLTPAYRKMVRAMVSDPSIAGEQAAISVLNAGAPVGSGSRAADLLGAAGLVVNQIATAPRVTTTRIEAGGGAKHSAALVAHVLGLPADVLSIDGDSTNVKVLLGPDLELPAGT